MGGAPERWVGVNVVEAYIHCSKHIPQLRSAVEDVRQAWGTDDVVRKGGDYFKAKHSPRPWVDDDAAVPAASRAPAARRQRLTAGSRPGVR